MSVAESTRVPVLVTYGTVPEAIKMAPVVRALERSAWVRPFVVVAGRRSERMLSHVHELLDVTPAMDLDIVEPAQSSTRLTVRAIQRFEHLFSEHVVGAVAVHGGATVALAASLAASHAHVPTIHVEALLPSWRVDQQARRADGSPAPCADRLQPHEPAR